MTGAQILQFAIDVPSCAAALLLRMNAERAWGWFRGANTYCRGTHRAAYVGIGLLAVYLLLFIQVRGALGSPLFALSDHTLRAAVLQDVRGAQQARCGRRGRRGARRCPAPPRGAAQRGIADSDASPKTQICAALIARSSRASQPRLNHFVVVLAQRPQREDVAIVRIRDLL